MKKILIAICLLVSVMLISRTHIFKFNEWYYSESTYASDTMGTGDSTWDRSVALPSHGDCLKYNIYMDVDSIGGTAVTTYYRFYIGYKNSEDQSYTKLDSTDYYGTADTTFSFSDLDSAYCGKYWKVWAEGSADGLAVEIQILNWAFFK